MLHFYMVGIDEVDRYKCTDLKKYIYINYTSLIYSSIRFLFQDEWCLIFNYILGFPSLLDKCVEIKDKSCEFRPHHLCSFLCSMVRVFSQYYRRVRILTVSNCFITSDLYKYNFYLN